VASRNQDPRSILLADEAAVSKPQGPTLEVPLGFYWTEGRSGVGLTVNGIPPLKGGSSLGIPSAPAVLFPDGEVLMPSLSACESLQGFEKGWTAAAATDGARGPRWRLLGNAVSVPVASWVASRIRSPGDPLSLESFALDDSSRWPDAAYNIGKGRIGVKASDKPIAAAARSIDDYRDAGWHLLSDRALTGFLSRAVEGGLRFPIGFLDAVARANRRAKKAA
jgi:DNA (cytosine-5)-methyltransferase 1